jgi:hypothetical protein
MSNPMFTALLALGLAACSRGSARAVEGEGAASVQRSLASGTRVDAIIQDSLSSRINVAGETLRATVSTDIKNDQGAVVIPAGSPITLTIAQLDPGSGRIRPKGRLSLVVTSVSVGGHDYRVSAALQPIPHHMVGRGVTRHKVARVGAGTVVGAITGQSDVVVSARTPIVFSLTQSLSIPAR